MSDEVTLEAFERLLDEKLDPIKKDLAEIRRDFGAVREDLAKIRTDSAEIARNIEATRKDLVEVRNNLFSPSVPNTSSRRTVRPHSASGRPNWCSMQ